VPPSAWGLLSGQFRLREVTMNGLIPEHLFVNLVQWCACTLAVLSAVVSFFLVPRA
jgi:hypothetical protein